jgi:dienelactone hydrolase
MLAPLILSFASLAVLVTIAVAADDAATRYPDHQDLSYYLDASGARRPVRTPADWQRRREHVLAGMQQVMGPLPKADQRVPLEMRTEEEVRVGDLVRRKITYQTSPGHRIAAYLFLPPLPEGRQAPAMLCLHPTGELGKGIVSGLGGKANRQYALELAQRGYVTLAPDYPTFGDYAWELKPDGGWQSGTMRAIWDNIRSVDLLQSLPEVDGERIGAIGHSLGGHNAIFTAVFEPRIKAVVSSCGFTRFHKYYEGKLAGWTSPRYMPRIATVYGNDPDRVPFDFPELLAALAPRAFFTNSPLRDANFEVSGVRDCMAAAKPVFALHGVPGNLVAIYPDVEHDFPDDAREQAYAFLDRQLKVTARKTR